ncbi:MAG TPA: polysaccharide biosynthesis C-terminal domain-containing protein [Puia sp.]|jgi:O-antigen/teichoic acid export membrane protein|nr:polysaccharide biosynthesis C-terminal domain-containing protein [Puia sp.]
MEIKKYLIQNFISRFCFLASTFLVNILFANLLSASGSGALYYTINNFSVITLLASLSLESGITYFLSKKEIDDKELATLSLLWSLTASILVTALLLFLRDNYFAATKYNTPAYSLLFISGSLLTTYYSGLFFARQNFILPQLIPAVSNFCIVFVGGWFFFITKEKSDADHIIAIYFAGFIASGLALCTIYHAKFFSGIALRVPTKNNIKKLLHYSIFALFTNIIAFLAYRIDYWILKAFSPAIISDSALGNYIQVSKLVQLFLFVPTIVATIVFPTSAAGVNLDFHKQFRKMIQRAFLLNVIGCGFVLIAGKWMFTFLFGMSFSLMYMCFVFSIPAILAITVVRILASYFAGTNRIKYNLAGSLIALVVIIFLNLLLIPLMGINGAALADSAGYISYMVFLLILFSKKR